MGKFSNYRYLELKDEASPRPPAPRSRALKQPRRMRRAMLLVIAATAVIYFSGVFLSQSRALDAVARRLGYRGAEHCAVVVDAGSSGSRVLAYRFRVPFTIGGVSNLELVEEFFKETKPGLSSYVDDPEKGAETIAALVRSAGAAVPAAARGRSALLVRATAGLRLLPPARAQRLVDEVRRAVAGLGYTTGADTVQIMDGSDEGIYIWYTVNLLHDTLDSDESLAALDLGGGSTQITYRAAGDEPAGDRRLVRTGSYNVSVFTHSYNGLGLLAARHGILMRESAGCPDEGPCPAAAAASAASGPANRTLRSVCVDPIVQDEKWTYANVEYSVSGAARAGGAKPAAWYAACRAAARAHVLAALDWAPARAPPAAIAAMSFYYDVAADAGIIDVMSGGATTVAAYRAAATAACGASNVEQPWACLDLVYVVTLLHDVYRIKDTEPIMLFKKVDGHEVSWALGLAYTTVMNQLAAQPS